MSFPTKKAQQLKKQFHSTRKGDDETIESYVKRLKSVADSVAAIDSPISDSDMALQLVAGLPSEYEPVKKIISSKWPLPTFEEACSKVYVQEGILMQVKISFPTEEDDNSNKNEKIPIQDDQIKRVQLRMQFHSTRKGDDETTESYVKRLKSIADSLEAIDPISDSDMVLQLLAGLPSEYETLKKIISSRWPLPTFEDACSMVSMQERKFLQRSWVRAVKTTSYRNAGNAKYKRPLWSGLLANPAHSRSFVHRLGDHHERQNTTDPRVDGEEESSSFFTLETGVTIAGIVSPLLGAFGLGGASKMIAIGSMSAVGAVACSGWLENLATRKKSD